MQRVTFNQLLAYNRAQATRQTANAARLQAQISSGKRIAKPSDDPAGQRLILHQQSVIRSLEATRDAIGTARNQLNTSHRAVLEAQQVFVKAQSLALQGRQATDPAEIEAIAREIDSLLQRLTSIANTRVGGESLFGGDDTLSDPFTTSQPGDIPHYQGSHQSGVRVIGGESLQVLYAGSDVFRTTGRGDTLILGSTGATPANGTSSARGVRELNIRHGITSFFGTSGIQAGTGTGSDTIVGPPGAHVLTIHDTSGTGTSGTVSLNGGPEVAFTSSDTNLVVTGPAGEIVHLDTTAMTPGFSGTIDLAASGFASIDGGLTEVPVDFSANQTLIDSRDGSVIHVNTQNVLRSGTDYVDLTATADAFQVLSQLQADLRNLADLPASERDAALSRRLEDIERIQTHLLGIVGEQSVTLQTLDSMQQRTEDLLLSAESRLTEVQGTDYAQAVLQLQAEQTLLQFSLTSAVRLFDFSIIPFLT